MHVSASLNRMRLLRICCPAPATLDAPYSIMMKPACRRSRHPCEASETSEGCKRGRVSRSRACQPARTNLHEEHWTCASPNRQAAATTTNHVRVNRVRWACTTYAHEQHSTPPCTTSPMKADMSRKDSFVAVATSHSAVQASSDTGARDGEGSMHASQTPSDRVHSGLARTPAMAHAVTYVQCKLWSLGTEQEHIHTAAGCACRRRVQERGPSPRWRPPGHARILTQVVDTLREPWPPPSLLPVTAACSPSRSHG